MLPLAEETAVHAVVGSIVWAFHRLKKPGIRDMSARGYAGFWEANFIARGGYGHKLWGRTS